MSYTELTSKHVCGLKECGCEWCGETILKAEKQLYRTYIFEGEFKTGRMHLECEKAMQDAPSYDLEEGWPRGSNERGIK